MVTTRVMQLYNLQELGGFQGEYAIIANVLQNAVLVVTLSRTLPSSSLEVCLPDEKLVR